MDQINEPVDILIQYRDNNNDDDQSNHDQMVKLSQLKLTSTRLLYSIQQRDILSIRQYFKNKNWLLLSTYATMNTMYLCTKLEFEQKISEYFIQTKSYTLIKQCSEIDQDNIKCFFNELFQHIDLNLCYLYYNHRITVDQYIQMMSTNKRDDNQINSMIFLPDTRTEVVSYRPIMSNISGPINYISEYLHQCLQTTYYLVAHSTTFNNGFHLVQAIEAFTKKGFLKPTTQFVVMEIKDFDVTFIHKQIIETLKLFLNDCISHRRSKISTNLSNKTIIQLVKLVLKTQYFMYDNKLYRQIKGSNPNSSLTKLLVNIYLLYWQHDLMEFLKKKNELFGRCYNKIFFTWNGSKCQFNNLCQQIKTNLPDLQIQLSIGTSIHYLDVDITQINGILRTKVYRYGLTEPYTLPYLINHPSNHYANIIRSHLIHAIQLCTNVEDFQNENLFIFSTCLFNRFPLDFIIQCIHQFFNEFNPSKLNNRYNQQDYECLRQHVIIDGCRISCLSINNKRSCSDNEDLDIETNVKQIKTE